LRLNGQGVDVAAAVLSAADVDVPRKAVMAMVAASFNGN